MAKRPTGLFGNLTQKMVPIIGNWVVPFEEIRWYPFRKLAGTLSGNSATGSNVINETLMETLSEIKNS